MSIAGIGKPMLAAPRLAGMPHMGGIMHPPKTGFSGGIRGFDIGGATGTGIGGPPPSIQDQNPQMQGVVQRYASLPTEQLQELSQRMQGTPYAPIIQKILQQKQTQPQGAQQTPAAPAAAPTGISGAMPQMAQARGGATQHRANGGMSSGDVTSAERGAANQISSQGSGFLGGSTMGRADALDTTAPSGSYILPADVVSGLGEGSSLAGARAVEEMLRTGPWGTPQVQQRRGSGPPRPPSIRQADSKGGGVKGDVTAGHVPVLLSDGEYQVGVPHVVAIGRHYLMEHAKKIGKKGILFTAQQCLKAGHKILDAFVLQQRKEHIKKLKSLPGPVRAK